MTTTITRARYEAALLAGRVRYGQPEAVFTDGIKAFLAAACITVSDADPAQPAVVRISRAAYEAALDKLHELDARDAYRTHDELLRPVFAAAGIEVEPEPTAEERLAELEARVAAFAKQARGFLNEDGICRDWQGVARAALLHFPEVRRDGR